MKPDKSIRTQLVSHLQGEKTSIPIDELIYRIPFEKLGVKPHDLPYSLWQQFYHLKFTQWDILDFSRNPDYQEMSWPDDYWPKDAAPPDEKTWKQTVKEYVEEREQFINVIRDETNDLYKPFPHGDGQNLLNEALLVIGHTAYHTGQILIIMRLLGLYK